MGANDDGKFVQGVHHFCTTIETMGKEHREELGQLRAEIRRLRAALGWYVGRDAQSLMMFGSSHAVDALREGAPDGAD